MVRKKKTESSSEEMLSAYEKFSELAPEDRLDFYRRLRGEKTRFRNAPSAFDPTFPIDRLKIYPSGRIGIRSPRVFLSHSRADKPFVRKLSERLRRNNIDFWLDEAEIHHGDSLIERIGVAINGVDVMLAFLSKHSITSGWVQRELEIALTREIQGKRMRVIPVLLENVELPPFLSGKLYADFTDKASKEATTKRLIVSIKRFLISGDDNA